VLALLLVALCRLLLRLLWCPLLLLLLLLLMLLLLLLLLESENRESKATRFDLGPRASKSSAIKGRIIFPKWRCLSRI